MHRSVALAAVLLVAPLALAGCAPHVGSCSDFISLPTPQARFDAAPIVVVATVAETDRTVEPDAIYPVFRAHVVQVVKGSLAATDVDVYNPSDQCITYGEPAEYEDGDRLAGATRAVLYLAKDRSLLHLFVPGALDPLPEGSPLPFSTASPTASPQ